MARRSSTTSGRLQFSNAEQCDTAAAQLEAELADPDVQGLTCVEVTSALTLDAKILAADVGSLPAALREVVCAQTAAAYLCLSKLGSVGSELDAMSVAATAPTIITISVTGNACESIRCVAAQAAADIDTPAEIWALEDDAAGVADVDASGESQDLELSGLEVGTSYAVMCVQSARNPSATKDTVSYSHQAPSGPITQATTALECAHGTISDSDGQFSCACDVGYAGGGV